MPWNGRSITQGALIIETFNLIDLRNETGHLTLFKSKSIDQSLSYADPFQLHLAQWLYYLTHLSGTQDNDFTLILDLLADGLENASKGPFPHLPNREEREADVRKRSPRRKRKLLA